MNSEQSSEHALRRPLRLWPGAVLAGLQIVCWYVVPVISPDSALYAFLGTVICALGILLWWLLFSRAPWLERLGVIILMGTAILGTSRVVHVSLAQLGQGMFFYIYSLLLMTFVLAVSLLASQRFSDKLRRAIMAASLLLACSGFTLLRSDGLTFGGAQYSWRWTPTYEEQLLAQGSDKPLPPPPAPAVLHPGKVEFPGEQPAARGAEKNLATQPSAAVAEPLVAWPGFRGPNRDSIIAGVRINVEWSAAPPVEQWRRAVGPGWSSFAVRGELLYTQEQRGESEIVACYNAATGKPVWEHRDATRFWEANAGAGPRGTPTLSGGRVYTFGATGILNALDANTGAVLWSRNVGADADKKVPYWGFSSSPLVVGDAVIVAASGKLAAYDATTGKLRWLGPAKGGSYSSPHLLTLDGVQQILMPSADGLTSVAPADGAVLWEHAWALGGITILQPAQAPNGDVLITTGDGAGGAGMRRIAVARDSGGWKIQERWTSRGLKPYFNDFVVHQGHAYGFDGAILACINLEDGQRKWKGGRYGQGQLVLLSDQDLLLVLSEEGELALVSATPDQFKELARFTAIEGKTWNHPVLVGDLLLVRNDHEMAAFRLSRAKN